MPENSPALPGFAGASPCREASADGVPDYAAVMESFARYVGEERPAVESPEQAARLMQPVLHGCLQEQFWVLLLDAKLRLIESVRITVGLVDRTVVHAREIFRSAVAASASRIVLVHNHPSGDPTPSARDIACTKNLAEAGKFVGIEIIDHLTVGTRTASRPRFWLSFREQNLLKK